MNNIIVDYVPPETKRPYVVVALPQVEGEDVGRSINAYLTLGQARELYEQLGNALLEAAHND